MLDDDLAVEHDALGQRSLDSRHELGEGIGEIVATPPLDDDSITGAEYDRAESVPLGLEGQVGTDRHGIAAWRGQHRRNGRFHREPQVSRHARMVARLLAA